MVFYEKDFERPAETVVVNETMIDITLSSTGVNYGILINVMENFMINTSYTR